MKTLAYLECPTGISGDMCLGALVHAGVPFTYLQQNLARLGLQNEFSLRTETVLRNQQSATKVHVNLHQHSHPHDEQIPDHHHDHHNHHEHDAHGRHLPEIESIIQQADLPERVTQWSLAIFRYLAKAEASVHGIPPEKVHFHEVGATDAIVDIVGTCLGFDWLDIDGLICSPLPTGGGTVHCDHGVLPVPVPAVLNMMVSAQIPVYSNGIQKELVTPTGCAIAATLSQSFGPPPRFTLQTIGLGAGGRNLTLPNILRLWIGKVDELPSPAAHKHTATHSHTHAHHTHTPHTASIPHIHPPESNNSEPSVSSIESITELQTQLDDCSPQAIGYIYEQLFAAGAVDVFSQPVAMKKNRLGTLLTVLCPEKAAIACEQILFQETTTLGIRRTQQQRAVLTREMVPVATEYGEVAIKVARAHAGGEVLNVHPEYEDCADLARSHNLPWQKIHQAALSAALQQLQTEPADTRSNHTIT
ncbi:MAG: nickel pincer cofactor biosynthesis protein LarC [Cyanobacteria bacterium J06649_4]